MDHKIPVNPNWIRYKTPHSSQAHEYIYDEKNKTMYVHFKSNDSVYSYIPVERKKFDALQDAPSAGAYFHKHFKKSDKLKIKAV